MKLEPGLLPAALAAGVDVRAARLVALPDGAANLGRNVAAGVRRLRRGAIPARRGARRWRNLVRGLLGPVQRLRSPWARASRMFALLELAHEELERAALHLQQIASRQVVLE